METLNVDNRIFVHYKNKALADYFEANEKLKDEMLDECEEILASYDSKKMDIYITYDDGDSVEEWYVDKYSEKK